MHLRLMVASLAVVSICALCGCGGGGGQVTGTVKYKADQQPLKDGTVVFDSEDLTRSYSGDIKEGKYTISNIPPGKYLVGVNSGVESAVAEKYELADQSGLTHTVTEEGGTYDITVEKGIGYDNTDADADASAPSPDG